MYVFSVCITVYYRGETKWVFCMPLACFILDSVYTLEQALTTSQLSPLCNLEKDPINSGKATSGFPVVPLEIITFYGCWWL